MGACSMLALEGGEYSEKAGKLFGLVKVLSSCSCIFNSCASEQCIWVKLISTKLHGWKL